MNIYRGKKIKIPYKRTFVLNTLKEHRKISAHRM